MTVFTISQGWQCLIKVDICRAEGSYPRAAIMTVLTISQGWQRLIKLISAGLRAAIPGQLSWQYLPYRKVDSVSSKLISAGLRAAIPGQLSWQYLPYRKVDSVSSKLISAGLTAAIMTVLTILQGWQRLIKVDICRADGSYHDSTNHIARLTVSHQSWYLQGWRQLSWQYLPYHKVDSVSSKLISAGLRAAIMTVLTISQGWQRLIKVDVCRAEGSYHDSLTVASQRILE